MNINSVQQLLSSIAFDIYGLVVMSSVSTDINIVASRYDEKKTMLYCLLCFIIALNNIDG